MVNTVRHRPRTHGLRTSLQSIIWTIIPRHHRPPIVLLRCRGVDRRDASWTGRQAGAVEVATSPSVHEVVRRLASPRIWRNVRAWELRLRLVHRPGVQRVGVWWRHVRDEEGFHRRHGVSLGSTLWYGRISSESQNIITYLLAGLVLVFSLPLSLPAMFEGWMSWCTRDASRRCRFYTTTGGMARNPAFQYTRA